MADKRRKRYNLDFDDTDSYSRSTSRNRNSQRSESRNYSRNKDTRSYSRDTDTRSYSRNTESRNYSNVNFDTSAVSRNLEAQADEHITRTRGSQRYTQGSSIPQKSPRRNTSSLTRSSNQRTSRENPEVSQDPQSSDPHEERYRRLRKLRREAALWKRMHWVVRGLILLFIVADLLILRFGVFSGGFLPVWNVLTSKSTKTETAAEETGSQLPIVDELLTVNEHTRPGTKLQAINGIVIHYVGNPGTTAQANRDYFESLKDDTSDISTGAHYIIGLDGTIIRCIPDDEMAYASGERNTDTISILFCHPDESGVFTTETFNSLVLLTAQLCNEYNLSIDQVMRHYDVNGKPCPKHMTENPDEWTNFLASVESCM